MLHIELLSRRRLPVILQTQATECAHACLAMISSYYGREIDLITLRQKVAVPTRGLNLEQVIDIASSLDLAARPLRAELEYLVQVRTPAILHWDFNHFVVLKHIKINRVIIHDPSRGEVSLTLAEIDRHFTGIVLELIPTPTFHKEDERTEFSLIKLWGKHDGIKAVLTQVLVYSVALEIFSILSPLFVQLAVDQVLAVNDRNLLVTLALGFVFLALVQAVTMAVRSWVVLFLGANLNYQMISRLFHHLLKLPMDYFERRHLGDLVSRFSSMQEIQQTLSTQFIETVVDGGMVLGTLSIMFLYSVDLGLLSAGTIAIYLLLRLCLFKRLYQATEEHIVKLAYTQSNFLETLQGIQSVKLFSKQSLRLVVWQNFFVKTIRAQIKAQKLDIAFKSGEKVIFGVGNVLVIALGILEVMEGQLSLGMLFAFLAFQAQFSKSSSDVIEKAMQYKMLDLHGQRVADIALSQPEESVVENDDRISASADMGIRLSNIGFRYSSGDPYVFRNIDLEVKPEESLAIVGPSGCGKTTLLKIIAGLLVPCEGEVSLDGRPMSSIGLLNYRRYLSGVMQEDTLFSGSLGQNIAFFDPRPDDDRIVICAEAAAIHQDIIGMPMGYNTLIGDMGDTLSGGQRQRILLARALYHQPRILLLDEATSNLDTDKEYEISRAISRMAITRIIVAHRRETIRSADRIFDLGEAIASSDAKRVPASAAT